MSDRVRPRVSLLSLLLIVALVASWCVIVQLWLQVTSLEGLYAKESLLSARLSFDLRQLRYACGDVDIRDPTALQVARLPTNVQSEWAFLVWIPEGANYALRHTQGTAPSAGTPAQGSLLAKLKPGRRWVSYSVQRDALTGGVGALFETDGKPVTPLSADWFEHSVDGDVAPWESCGVDRSTSKYSVGESVVLIRHRVGAAKATDEPAPGFVLWLEPVP